MKTTKTKNLLLGIAIGIGTSFATIAQNLPSYLPTNGLVGWWPFNGNANDESGNNNNGTVNGATLTTDRFGNVNSAYKFNGYSNSISCPNNNSLSISSSITVGAWLKPSRMNFNTVANILFRKGGTYTPSWSLNQEIGNNFVFYIHNGGWVNSGPSYTPIDTLNWYFVLGSYDGAVLKLYVNGQLESSSNISGNIDLTNDSLYFGKDPANGNTAWLKGNLSDLFIYNRALTQQEITDLYNAVNCNLTISPQNNTLQIGNTAIFNATTSDPNPNYIWQSDLGQGFQTLNNYGNYSGVNTSTLNIANVQLANHNQPIRAISNSGNCVDTSNVAYINIADTCITTVYDTITTYVSVTDTLFINVNTVGLNNNTIINTIKVFPNPANSHLNLDFGNFNSLNGYSIKIYNSLSQVIYNQQITQQSETIDLSTFGGNGVYFLHVINAQNNTVEIRKIVLQ